MLIHLRPRMYCPFKNVTLIDLEIEPFGLNLRNGIELRTGRPYPNRFHTVASRKVGRRALVGILIETSKPVDEFQYAARWAVEAQLVVRHEVKFKVLDRDFDAVTDEFIAWHAFYGKNWGHRVPKELEKPDAQHEPCMEVLSPERSRERDDVVDQRTGLIMLRREVFQMPTIETERLLNHLEGGWMPKREMAFRCEPT